MKKKTKKMKLKHTMLCAFIVGAISTGLPSSADIVINADDAPYDVTDSSITQDIINHGELNIQDGGSISTEITSDGVLTNAPLGEIHGNVTNSGTFTNEGTVDSHVTNSGTFSTSQNIANDVNNSGNGSFTGSSSAGITGVLTNSGSASAELEGDVGGIVNSSSNNVSVNSVTTSGVQNSGAGNITITNGVTNGDVKNNGAGKITISSGGVSNGSVESTSGDIDITGNVSSTITSSKGQVTIDGDVAGITATGTGKVEADNVTTGGVDVEDTASVKVNGNVTGNVQNKSSSSSAVDITGDITGNLNSTNGTVKTGDITGSTTITGGNATLKKLGNGLEASGSSSVTANEVSDGGITIKNTAAVTVNGNIKGDVNNTSTSSAALTSGGNIDGKLTTSAGTVNVKEISNGIVASGNAKVDATKVTDGGITSSSSGMVKVTGDVKGDVTSTKGKISVKGYTIDGNVTNSGTDKIDADVVTGSVENKSSGQVVVYDTVKENVINTSTTNTATVTVVNEVEGYVQNNGKGRVTVGSVGQYVTNTGDGGVTVNGDIGGDVTNSGKGSIEATNHTVSGSVLNKGEGEIIVGDVNGNITTEEASSGSVTANAVSGDIEHNGTGSISADTAANVTNNSTSAEGIVNIEGDITGNAENNGAGDITAANVGGSVSTTDESSGDVKITGNIAQGVTHAGSGEVKATNVQANGVSNTGSGTVRIIEDITGNVLNTADGEVRAKNVTGNIENTNAATGNITVSNHVEGNITNESAESTTISAGSVTGNITAIKSGNISVTIGDVVGNVTNKGSGTITTQNVTGDVAGMGSGKTQVQDVTGKVTNNGTGDVFANNVTENVTNIGEGNITVNKAQKDVINSGEGTVTTKDKVGGNVENNGGGTYINKGGVAGNLNNAGGSIVENKADVDGTINNDAQFNNSAKITGVVNNTGNGVFTSSVNDLAETATINNTGTLELSGNGGSTLVDIKGTGTVAVHSNLKLDNSIDGNTLQLNKGTLTFGAVNEVGAFEGIGGTVNIIDGELTEAANLGDITLSGKTNLALDFDINSETTDTIAYDTITNNGGSFNVSAVRVQGMTLKEYIRVNLGETTTLGAENVTSNKFRLPSILTPIKKLKGTVSNGYLTYDGRGRHYGVYNPCVVASEVATQIGGFLNQSHMLQEGFYHMNRYMNNPSKERFASEHSNTYATSSNNLPYYNDPTIPEESAGMWVLPNATFEKVELRGGPGVSNVSWGMMIGGDSPVMEYRNGWKGVISAFVSYNGNHMAYDCVDADMNLGGLGLTHTWYKGNFFTGVTISGSAGVGDAHTMYGRDDYWMLTGGAGSKTGYNWEIKEGKLIVQPSLFVGYTFVNTFDYTNSAGVRISTEPLNAVQIIPGLKVVGNLKNGWQPYAGFDLVFNIIDKTHFMANDIFLPTMSVKPYAQYGFGIQKTWKEKFTGFFQTMFRSGGRDGVVFSFGFRWAFGKDSADASSMKKKSIKN